MNSSNKTFLPKQTYKNRNWYIIDCKGQKLGRLATIIANLLQGKIKTDYHPSIDAGDYVILINANSILINENKKHYLVYNPGRPGNSLKIKKASDCLSSLTITRAVKRMISKTKNKKLMTRLKIYSTNKHLHEAQNPTRIDPTNLYLSIK